ncbi:MAG: DUF975 family protein [Limisphaerales bacterium]
MASYTIIGGDQKPYSSVTADDIRRWIADGRLNAQSLAKEENDTEWRPLSAFPEFADIFAASSAPIAPPPVRPSAEWQEHDYDLDLGGCISRGFGLLKTNFGVLFVAVLLFVVIEVFIAGLGAIPFIGALFSIANMIIIGPLLGGLYYVIIQAIRSQPASAGDVFAGFRKGFLQLFLGKIVSGLLAGLCMIPFVVVMLVLVFSLAATRHGQPPEEQLHSLLMGLLPIGLPVFLICMIPTIYLQVRWVFTLPLIIDKQMDFWTAMKTSWKMVGKHWWQVFGLVILIGLLNIVGVLACCVGALFTAPIGYAALMYAYETIFSPAGSQAG